MATKGTRNKKVEATEAQTILDSVKDLDLQKVVGEISNLQLSVQGTLAGLTATLTNKVQKMEQVDQAIGLKEDRLSELYGIEAAAVALDDLKAQHQEEQIAWQRDKDAQRTTWAEEYAERNKRWARENEEHTYAVDQAQKRANEEFAAEVAAHRRAETQRQEALERSWSERESTLKSQEKEVDELRAQVAQTDAKIKSEVAKAEAVLGNVLKRNYEHETALLKKDVESERAMHALKVASMDATVASLNQQVSDLQEQLAAARADAKEVASQALQSASGRQVADALQRVVDQRDNVQKTK